MIRLSEHSIGSEMSVDISRQVGCLWKLIIWPTPELMWTFPLRFLQNSSRHFSESDQATFIWPNFLVICQGMVDFIFICNRSVPFGSMAVRCWLVSRLPTYKVGVVIWGGMPPILWWPILWWPPLLFWVQPTISKSVWLRLKWYLFGVRNSFETF